MSASCESSSGCFFDGGHFSHFAQRDARHFPAFPTTKRLEIIFGNVSRRERAQIGQHSPRAALRLADFRVGQP